MTQQRFRGFTLVELTIVLVIVALLTGGMLSSLSASRDIAQATETQKQISSIHEALFGFAAARGRLPCPAAENSNGLEQFCETVGSCTTPTTVVQTHGRCAEPYNGFVPAASLGLSPTTPAGLASDSWGNPIRYAVTQAPAGAINFPFTASTVTDGIKPAWAVTPFPLAPDLHVCNTATNITFAGTATATCPAADQMTNSAVAVVFSTGKNGGTSPSSADELANWKTSGDRVFVRSNPQNFDDIVTWLSPNTVYNRMITAGRLP